MSLHYTRKARLAVRRHARALFRRGRKLAGQFSEERVEEGVRLLDMAYSLGLREAGVEVALLSKSEASRSAISVSEQDDLLIYSAKAGNPIPALELYYGNRGNLTEYDMLRLMKRVSHRSAEARDIADRLCKKLNIV